MTLHLDANDVSVSWLRPHAPETPAVLDGQPELEQGEEPEPAADVHEADKPQDDESDGRRGTTHRGR